MATIWLRFVFLSFALFFFVGEDYAVIVVVAAGSLRGYNTGSSVKDYALVRTSHSYDFVERVSSLGDARV